MDNAVLVSIVCRDRPGLVAAISGRLYDMGANLADTTFAVLGEGAEFTAVVIPPAGQGAQDIRWELAALPEIGDGTVDVRDWRLATHHGPSGRITHRIEVAGGDQPGLIARLSEVFGQFGANIVRLNAETIPGTGGAQYVTRFAVWIPAERADACLATVGNTAGELRLVYRWNRA
ncbi:MAG: amino acid-binding protein [Alphaproteobacteria bacterium]|nr:amino acid-binding protein [Alphaproteobacteria bacterium]